VHAHEPFEHTSPPLQIVPHLPQSFGSLFSLTQAPLQLTWPVGHVAAHAPFEQTPPSHEIPHAPQFDGLDARSTHNPEHRAGVVPVVHVQALFTHCSPPPHVAPQAPQFAGSSVRLTHAPPLQSVSPVAQLEAHAPFEHTCPLQRFAHVPQLFGSDARSTQTPLHAVVPDGHVPPSGSPPSPPSGCGPASDVLASFEASFELVVASPPPSEVVVTKASVCTPPSTISVTPVSRTSVRPHATTDVANSKERSVFFEIMGPP
jgi:hypothetical protein